jgi:integrase
MVKDFIAQMQVSNCYKESIVNAYVHYVRINGLSWTKPVYKRAERLPNVPSTEQVDKIISGAGKKYSMIFSILRDTGLRPIELSRLSLKDIDLEKGIVYPQTAKGGSSRALKLKSSTLAMLKEYLVNHECKFPHTNRMTHMWIRCRNRIAKKLQEPELKKYRLYDLRHYFATMLYHKTRDILFVKQQLGHRRIEHTLIYTHLVNFKDDEYHAMVGRSIQECCKLVEAGFQFVCEVDGAKLFRKPK